MATYLIDKAQDLSWSCVVDGASYGNPSRMDYNPNDPYRSGSGSSYGGSGYGNSQYDRDRTTYDNRQPYDPNRGQYGSQYGNGQYDPNRNTYDRDRYGGTGSSSGQYGSGSQYGGSQLGSQYGGSGSQYGSSQYGSNQPIGNTFYFKFFQITNSSNLRSIRRRRLYADRWLVSREVGLFR